jgi:quercetin dioxygenase-like cupin family protein
MINFNNIRPIKIIEKPWGHEFLLAKPNPQIQLKTLHIKKGERLSLQYHKFKAEFMICLEGEFQMSGSSDIYKEGDYFYIAPKTVHRIIAIKDTVIIELSIGSDKDIVRLDDKYGRVKLGDQQVLD